jgi:hypothetical protein
MRVFLIPKFAKFAKGEAITDAKLLKAAEGAATNPDAVLGGGLVKQRIARQGQGESGGYRSILCLQKDDRAVFLHGFAKSDADNITPKALKVFKEVAALYLGFTDDELSQLVENGELREIDHAENDEEQPPSSGRTKRRRG